MSHFHPVIRLSTIALVAANGLLVSTADALDMATLTRSVDEARANRYQRFQNFQIKGVCGTTRLDLAAEYGANTVRTYVPPLREQLDDYHRLGLKVIVGIWMPHQGENQGKDGVKWTYDYHKNGDEQVRNFVETLDRIGDHPAILMWCLGNEVHLDPPYLETVNRMSQVLHQKHPSQLSSLTIINAPEEKIALIKQHAADSDVIGYNSYGHGALGNASRTLEAHWGRAYYVSEFGPQGPWWGRQTSWGEVYEPSYDAKLNDLRQSFDKIDAAPRCLGSTMFLWGFWTQQRPTYFSAFLNPQDTRPMAGELDLYVTPMAEEFCRYWSGCYPATRAPILTQINIAGHSDDVHPTVWAGEPFQVTASATDPDTPAEQLHYRWWILDKGNRTVAGPIDTSRPAVELLAPATAGTHYAVMAYVIAPDRRASGFTVPLKVETGRAARLRVDSANQ